MIVTMLTRYFMILRKLAGAGQLPQRDLARHLGVPPYFVKEYQQALRRLGPHTVRWAFEALLAADYELKGGTARDERLVLLLVLGRILRPSTQAA